MISRNTFMALILFLLSLGVLGCSGGSDLGGLTGSVDDDGTMLADSRTTGTSGELTSLEGVSIPLADVYVDDELATYTDEDGAYTLSLTPGEHTIAFGYDEFIIHETTVSTDSREVMRFPRPPAVGSVEGTVYGGKFDAPEPPNPPTPPGPGDPPPPPPGDPEPPEGPRPPNPPEPPEGDFTPLEGAIVMVIDMNSRWIGADVTDEEGHYRIEEAPAGASRLLVFHRGYLPWSHRLFVNPDTIQYRDVYLREAPHFGHILGLVWDNEFNPIPNAQITLTKADDPEFLKTAVSFEFGAFLINRLDPGEYVIDVVKDGYEGINRQIYVHRGRNFEKFRLFPIEDDGGDG